MKNYVEIKLIIEQNLLDDSFTYYKFLVPVFRNLEAEFKVKINSEEVYQEFMTDLTSSGFINTMQYLELKTSKAVVEQVRPYFESVDYQFKTVLAQMYQTLENLQKSVKNNEDYLKDLQSWQIKIYQDFYETIKRLLAKFVIPSLVELILKTNSEQLRGALFQHQINEFFFDFKNRLSERSGDLLGIYLTKIYDFYGLVQNEDFYNYENTIDEAFMDFDQFNLIKVVDLNSALKLFNLPKNVEFKQIQSVYKRLAKQYHPDSNNKLADQHKMEQINLAYQILKEEYQLN